MRFKIYDEYRSTVPSIDVSAAARNFLDKFLVAEGTRGTWLKRLARHRFGAGGVAPGKGSEDADLRPLFSFLRRVAIRDGRTGIARQLVPGRRTEPRLEHSCVVVRHRERRIVPD